MFPDPLRQRLRDAGFVAVLILEDPDDAVPLARALMDGGVSAMELTLRTPSAIESLKRIRRDVPQMLAGVGTILTPGQATEASQAGAAFGVSPGLNPNVVRHADRSGFPFAPGVCTPTDIELAVEAGCRMLKFFPAEPIGGLAYLRSVAAPFAHLGVEFLPLGGVDADNMESYLLDPSVTAVGGSWVTPRSRIRERDWKAVTTLAAQAATIVARARPAAPPPGHATPERHPVTQPAANETGSNGPNGGTR